MNNNKKKKLLIVLPTHWSIQMGGTQYQIKCLVDHWAKTNRFDIYLLCREARRNTDENGYTLVTFKAINKLSKFSRIFDSFHLYRALVKINPDIIYQNIGTSYVGIVALYANNNNKKFILHIASDSDIKPYNKKANIRNIERQLDKLIFEFGLKRADNVIAQTEYQQNILKKTYNLKNTFIVKNFQNTTEEPKEKYKNITVLWVANFKPLKQPEIFINLANDFYKIDKSINFIMIGAPARWIPKWQQMLQNKIDKADNLEYIGVKSVGEVDNLLGKSHILINTSEYEGFSNTFIQAWFKNVPVISLNCDPDGILGKHNVGIYCDGSYDRLISSLKELSLDRGCLEAFSKNARTYAEKHHSIENTNLILKTINSY
jgi:glycosyltransferase involved in cell wall biosynthesis